MVTVGSFTAGAKHNIIPDEAHLKLTVRSYSDDVRQTLLDGIARIAKGQAETFGAPEPEIRIDSDYTPATFNDPELADRVGGAIGEAIGAENLKQLSPVMGGEDFSRYGRTPEDVPSVLFWVGAVEQEKYDASVQKPASALSCIRPSLFRILIKPLKRA